MADAARRRTCRPARWPGLGRRDRRAGPGRIPRPGRRRRRPPPAPARCSGAAPDRVPVIAGPRDRRPRTPRIPDADRRADGRPQGPPRRARRRTRPALGGGRPRARPPPTRWIGWSGSAAPPQSAPGGSCPATTTPPTRSALNLSQPPRTCVPPGTRPLPPSARLTALTSAACPTGCFCTCAIPTRSKPPGHRDTWVMRSARPAPPPGMPAWPGCALPPGPGRPAARPSRGKHPPA